MRLVSHRYPLVSLTILIWSAYFMLHILIPARSIYDTANYSLALVVLYLAICFIAVFSITAIANRERLHTHYVHLDRVGSLYLAFSPERVIRLLFFLSVVGIALHLYDKVVIMNINYLDGVARARHAWMEKGAFREGAVSSWQSALGHLMVNLYFGPLFLILLFWERIGGKFYRYIVPSILLTVLFIYSLTMGTRSVPLMLGVFLLTVLALRRTLGLPLLPWRSSNVLTLLLLTTIFLGYAIYVFDARAKAFAESPREYTRPFFPQLGAEETSSFEYGGILPGPISDLYYYGILTTLYVIHSQWTFDYVLTLDDRQGQSLFNTIYAGLVKVGALDEAGLEQRSFSGVFLSLPGSVWYDFGVVGLVLVAACHGGLLVFVHHTVRRRRPALPHIILFLLVGTFSILSPLTSAANLMVFPFMMISLLVTALFAMRTFRLPRIHRVRAVSLGK